MIKLIYISSYLFRDGVRVLILWTPAFLFKALMPGLGLGLLSIISGESTPTKNNVIIIMITRY